MAHARRMFHDALDNDKERATYALDQIQQLYIIERICKEESLKLLSPYETFIRQKLQAHPGVSAAQMHDWLKEYHPDFPHTAPKTV